MRFGMYRGARSSLAVQDPYPPGPLSLPEGKGGETRIRGSLAVFPPFAKGGTQGGSWLFSFAQFAVHFKQDGQDNQDKKNG
jgi:hypothetical protein